MSKLRKIVQVCERQFIKLFSYLDRDIYMKLYSAYLQKIGIRLNGIPRYIHPSVYFDGKGYDIISLGDRLVVSFGTVFLCHDYSIACGFRALGDDLSQEAFFLKPITIGNNVFIGCNVTILPGTTIGDDCIIGSGSVVKGFIPSGSVVTGEASKPRLEIDKWALRHRAAGDYFVEIQ